MIQQFQNLFCFGQPIWSTERRGAITGIAEMAEVRASISQQYYLFGNCTDAARQVIQPQILSLIYVFMTMPAGITNDDFTKTGSGLTFFGVFPMFVPSMSW
jgi:hypothetical protein